MLDTSAWWSMPKRRAGVALGVDVDDQDPQTGLGQRRGDVDRGRGLADAALLVGDGENPRLVRLREALAGQRDPAAGVHGDLARQRRVVVGGRQLVSQRGALPLVLRQRGIRRRRPVPPLVARFTWNAVRHGRLQCGLLAARQTPTAGASAAGAPCGVPRRAVRRFNGDTARDRASVRPRGLRCWRLNPPSRPNAASATAMSCRLCSCRLGHLPCRGITDPAQRARWFPVKHRPPTSVGPAAGWIVRGRESAPLGFGQPSPVDVVAVGVAGPRCWPTQARWSQSRRRHPSPHSRLPTQGSPDAATHRIRFRDRLLTAHTAGGQICAPTRPPAIVPFQRGTPPCDPSTGLSPPHRRRPIRTVRRAAAVMLAATVSAVAAVADRLAGACRRRPLSRRAGARPASHAPRSSPGR